MTKSRIDNASTGGQNPKHSPRPVATPCKHPIVKIVAREEDAEFVECQSCGEVFDSAEFEDMAVEEMDEMQHRQRDDADKI